MDNKQTKAIAKEADELLESEKRQKVVGLVKNLIEDVLVRYESEKKRKEELEERMRILKLDLDDLRNGRFDKIKERQDASKVAKNIGVDIDSVLNILFSKDVVNANWDNVTCIDNNFNFVPLTGASGTLEISTYSYAFPPSWWGNSLGGTFDSGGKLYYF